MIIRMMALFLVIQRHCSTITVVRIVSWMLRSGNTHPLCRFPLIINYDRSLSLLLPSTVGTITTIHLLTIYPSQLGTTRSTTVSARFKHPSDFGVQKFSPSFCYSQYHHHSAADQNKILHKSFPLWTNRLN